MSGHSKWNNIKRKKGAADAARGKIFTKIGREIQVAVRSGGPDPESNSKLKDIIAKAKINNIPNENIQRSIKKAAGSECGDNYEEILYEGYGPSGVAVMVRALTDNRNRTAGDVRHVFDRNGGNMGTNGCVSFLFRDKGTIVLDREQYDDEEAVMMDVLEAGADDFQTQDDVYVVTTEAGDYDAVRDALVEKGYVFLENSVGPVPLTRVKLEDEKVCSQMERLVDSLEDLDDVQEVYHNWDDET